MKHIHKLIVTSAAYRQSSKLSPELQEKDPYNKWLARAPRMRVESEIVRDVALSAGGLLSHKIGGPSVYPPIPDGVLSLGYGAQLPGLQRLRPSGQPGGPALQQRRPTRRDRA